jgi:HPt (histidine-containing phosphotransfer) domain-containing protein
MANMHESPATAAEQSPLRDEAPIDLAHLFRMTLGDRSLEREVLALFDRQIGMLIARIDGAEPAVIAALAHTLKGSARGVGAWPMARAAEGVEAAEGDELAPAVAALAATAAATRARITDLLRVKRRRPVPSEAV